MNLSRRNLPVILCLLLTASLSGCQSFKEASGLLEQQSATGMSSAELRAILDDLVLQYASRVELAADQIITQTSESEIHKNALLWKSNGISTCFQAATRRDPLAAFLNIWILNKQSLDLFRHPKSSRMFGPGQAIAVETTLQLEQSFDQILARIGKEFPIGEEFATRFASDHPIQNLYFDRASIAEHYTDYIAEITIKDRDFKEVVGNLDGQIDQFHKLSAMYAEFLPKQARWQAELLVLEAIPDDAFQTVLNEITSATESVRIMTSVADSIPNLVVQERDILRNTISEERIATMKSLEKIQFDTMRQLEQERVAVMLEFQKERETILDALKRERIAATENLTSFGHQIVDQVDSSANLKIDTLAEKGILITDHFFKRAVQMGMALLAVLAILWWLTCRNELFFPSRNTNRAGDINPPQESAESNHSSSDSNETGWHRAA